MIMILVLIKAHYVLYLQIDLNRSFSIKLSKHPKVELVDEIIKF